MGATTWAAVLGFIFSCACWAELQKIEVTVERKIGDRVERAEPNHVFEQGDLVRFRFKSSFNGFLYVMNQSTSGKSMVLFPKENAGLDNRIERNRAYVMPMTESGWFRVEGQPGYETLYWLVSPSTMAVPPLPTGPALNPAITPRCDDTIFRSRGECLDDTAGAKPVLKGTEVPPDLGALAGPSPRELTMMKSDKKTSIVANSGDGAPFFYIFRLAHK